MRLRSARSRISEGVGLPAVAGAAPELPARLAAVRKRGARGGRIAPHRAFITLHLTRTAVIAAVLLPLSMCVAWIGLNPWVAGAWAYVLDGSSRALALPARTLVTVYSWGSWLRVGIPFLDVPASPPTTEALLVTTAVTAVLFGMSFTLPERFTPVSYIVRLMAFVQITAIAYFTFNAARFPYRIAEHTLSGLSTGFTLVALVPLLFGFVFFIFDFPLYRKVGLTLLTMAHLAVLLPLQFVLHAYLLHHLSLVVMPVLFIFFGPLVEVMICVALYGWGVSWKGAVQPEGDQP